MEIASEDAETESHPSFGTTPFDKALSELGRWKLAHNDAQDLFNCLNIPFELLTKCRYKPNLDFLDYAAEKWYGLCAPKLKSVSKKIQISR